jgi:hypothetical protein
MQLPQIFDEVGLQLRGENQNFGNKEGNFFWVR